MAVLDKARTVGAPFGNESKLVTVTYDFSVDGGAVAGAAKLPDLGTFGSLDL